MLYLRDELGFDAAFDYHDGALVDRLREAAPDGVDVYFDNVGGSHLEAALEVMNPHGRVVLCGRCRGWAATTCRRHPQVRVLVRVGDDWFPVAARARVGET